MNFLIGRDNLALTVFVPWDCSNNCSFCTSKDSYKSKRPNLQNVKYQLEKVFKEYSFPIKDVVFSGGEPMANVNELEALIDLVPEDKNIFLNTTFVKNGLKDFLKLIEKGRIQGVNISRHNECYEKDCYELCNIATDDEINAISCNVRINCVLKDQIMNRLLNRWRGKDVTLNLRRDYRMMKLENLHNPYDLATMELINNGYQFEGHTQCNVCDTTFFKPSDESLPMVMYHKGLQNSSIVMGDDMEINDLIIDQTGRLMYDWDDCDLKTLDELLKSYKKSEMPNLILSMPSLRYLWGQHAPSYTCGGYHGCGRRC